jgi:hypothetical protein
VAQVDGDLFVPLVHRDAGGPAFNLKAPFSHGAVHCGAALWCLVNAPEEELLACSTVREVAVRAG